LRNTPGGAGYIGQVALWTGNTTTTLPDCPNTVTTGPAAGIQTYDVIELGSDSLSQAAMAQAIGTSLGLSHQAVDPFDLMSTRWDTRRYLGVNDSDPIKPAYGFTGPAVNTTHLQQIGFLDPERVFVATFPTGQHFIGGEITICPTLHLEYQGYRRAEIGPFALECRTQESWDGALPEKALVLAYQHQNEPQILTKGSTLTWGGPLRAIGGGGELTVTALSPFGANVSYQVADPVPIVAGGGALHGGGTILFTYDGRIIRIPPGDPAERAAGAALKQLEEIAKTIEQR
jgi:hypothetical protein